MRTDNRVVQIFIAEDSDADILLIQEALDTYKIQAQLQISHDGVTALSDLKRISEHDLPDIIILDLNLPGINGLQLLRYIRSSSLFDRIPVVVFTSSRSILDRTEAQRLGATLYLTKPPTLDDFLTTIGPTIYNLTSRSPSSSIGRETRRQSCPSGTGRYRIRFRVVFRAVVPAGRRPTSNR